MNYIIMYYIDTFCDKVATTTFLLVILVIRHC